MRAECGWEGMEMMASLFSFPGVLLAMLGLGESVMEGTSVEFGRGSIFDRTWRKVWMLVRREVKRDGLAASMAMAEEEVVVSKAGRDAEKTEAEELIRYTSAGCT